MADLDLATDSKPFGTVLATTGGVEVSLDPTARYAIHNFGAAAVYYAIDGETVLAESKTHPKQGTCNPYGGGTGMFGLAIAVGPTHTLKLKAASSTCVVTIERTGF